MTEETQPTLAELEELMEENLEVAKENTKLLKAMRRDALIGGILKTLVWVILIGASFYFSLQYLEPLMGSFTQATEGFTPEDYQALFEQYKTQLGQ